MLDRFKRWLKLRSTRKAVNLAMKKLCDDMRRKADGHKKIIEAINKGNIEKAKYITNKLKDK